MFQLELEDIGGVNTVKFLLCIGGRPFCGGGGPCECGCDDDLNAPYLIVGDDCRRNISGFRVVCQWEMARWFNW